MGLYRNRKKKQKFKKKTKYRTQSERWRENQCNHRTFTRKEE